MGELSIFCRTLAENMSTLSVECNSSSNVEFAVKDVPAFVLQLTILLMIYTQEMLGNYSMSKYL
jgi:hypothetical protein